MPKLRLDSDYMAGAHPEVLAALVETNFERTPGYGTDDISAEARNMILDACFPEGGKQRDDSRVYFLVGGTQTNSTVIAALLGHCEGVIAADTGHIAVHESGAVEATGHKVMTLPAVDGKIGAEAIAELVDSFRADPSKDHTVMPGMVYISQPTELGTLYSHDELKEISRVCRRYGLPLFVDGARLAYGLASESNDVSLADLASLADVFYIGGTKCGALMGEAIVVTDPGLMRHFTPLIKQRGGLLAKGRLLGLQFKALFSDGLYERVGQAGIATATILREAMKAHGYEPVVDSPTNQLFFLIPNAELEPLSQIATFETWGTPGPHYTAVRFVTDWALTPDDLTPLLDFLK
ncbi:MAG: aminotransferase class I/II-fold pyridoxal phosphate-dependent enzyme [Pseudoflavonifractor sp.]|nr:aminotransferase class I/II-fold pyridoxal phosphate-dependent enzyme [Alloprevotella sp.]MCM1116625.1 aminotransferase class I/II-fold pyridoxal phosphate-dependent enzyme [Pseudoflavonifractor sp.]